MHTTCFLIDTSSSSSSSSSSPLPTPGPCYGRVQPFRLLPAARSPHLRPRQHALLTHCGHQGTGRGGWRGCGSISFDSTCVACPYCQDSLHPEDRQQVSWDRGWTAWEFHPPACRVRQVRRHRRSAGPAPLQFILYHSLYLLIAYAYTTPSSPSSTDNHYFVLYICESCYLHYLVYFLDSSYKGWSFPSGASGREPACQCRRGKSPGFHPWIGVIPWRGHGNPLQYSCLENPMDRGAWRATVHEVTKSRTWWSNLACTHTHARL